MMDPFDAPSLEVGVLIGGLVALLAAWRVVAHGRAANRRMRAHNQAFARRVENLLAAQQQLLADTSHELRTPLTTVRGNLDLLQRDLPVAERTDVLTETREEVDRMAGLVRDLLLLAESGSGELQTERVPIRLDLLASEVIRRLDGGERVRLEAEPVTVLGDDERLRGLIGNLVQNALRHASDGAGAVCVRVARRPPDVWLVVEDDGPGVPTEALERVFDRFFRLDRGRSRSHGGSGLGLSIVRHVAEEHGGRAWAENRTDLPGARFVVSLPAEPSWVSDATEGLQGRGDDL
jgi:signal transduction histidine kinase